MTKIGLLSDTHGQIPDKIFEFFGSCDQVWHAGDIGNVQILDRLEQSFNLKAVHGNIDGAEIRSRCNETHIEIVDGLKMLMIHIGGYPGRYMPKARKMISMEKPGLFISGHSHILKVIYDQKLNVLHINPGAAGNSGFHQKITMVRFDVDAGRVQNLEVFEKDRKR
jgi:hypothetical protein